MTVPAPDAVFSEKMPTTEPSMSAAAYESRT